MPNPRRRQAEEVLSGSRSQRTMDMGVHASAAVQRAWRAASGSALAEEKVRFPLFDVAAHIELGALDS